MGLLQIDKMRRTSICRRHLAVAAISIVVALTPISVRAETVLAAVASNFADPIGALAEAFKKETGHSVSVSLGSTGKLYAQIRSGAPFDIFLSADEARAKLLVDDGIAVVESRFTYAEGQLVIWAPKAAARDEAVPEGHGIEARAAEVRDLMANARSIAIANPALAPYGKAAMQLLKTLPNWDRIEPLLVYGQNISQAYAMVATGNADAGLVAASQMARKESSNAGRSFPVDAKLHDPIRQDAVLLKRAEGNPAAVAFMAFLKSAAAKAMISEFGYAAGGP